MTKEEQAVEYANRRFATTRGFDGAVINNFLREGFLAGFTAGAAHERARAEGLCAALEIMAQVAPEYHADGCPCVVQDASDKHCICGARTAYAALAEYKRQRGET